MTVKTDNHNPKAKLDLRRYFLRRYHADTPPRVLDCCQGSGLLWKSLRDEFEVESYWGLDLKPKKGRLKLASERVLAQKGWNQNVVDIDTYGFPWRHWAAMLPAVHQPTTVFLTIGQVHIAGSPLQETARKILGIGSLKIPNAIGANLNKLATNYLLTLPQLFGIIIAEAVEAVSDGNARYIGVHLVPAQNSAPQSLPARRHKSKAVKEPCHV